MARVTQILKSLQEYSEGTLTVPDTPNTASMSKHIDAKTVMEK